MRYFNTTGPVDCQEHYCLPPLERFDLNAPLAAEAHLIIFDRREDWSWDDKVFRHEEAFEGHSITVWGM